ncbi:MAG: hypothetical protein ACE5JC_02555 [Candidatus Zixiibacteriota bacterium]
MDPLTTILLCSNSADTVELSRYLEKEGIRAELFPTLDKALPRFESGRFDTLLLVLAGNDSDKEQLEKLSVVKKLDPDLPVVAVSENDSIELERQARLEGIFYYLVQPVDQWELLEVLRQSTRFRLRRIKRRGK